MKQIKDEVPVTFSSHYFQVARSGYYRWQKPERSASFMRKSEICHEIEDAFEYSRQTYGSPRMTAELNNRGVAITENTVAKYMNELGLDARLKRKFRIVTTDSNHDGPIAPRLFKSEGENALPDAPGTLLAGDITYLRIPGGFMYLSVVMDLFNREIIGWSLDDNLAKTGVLKALGDAMRKTSPDVEVVFHSDRGSQYASEAFRKLLKNHNALPSMSRKGNCYDNCYVESWFKSLKTEWVYRQKIRDPGHLRKIIFEYIEAWYNTERRHSSLGNLSPRGYKKLKAVS